MPTSRIKALSSGGFARLVASVFFLFGLTGAPAAMAQSASTGPTTINVAATSNTTSAKRLGMNLGNQSFYDSGQLLRNITFRNPGFEGEQWQSVLQCAAVTSTSCTDDNLYTVWPANFLAGATAEFIVGKAAGTTATVTSNTTASVSGGHGVTVNFSGLSIAPSVGDFVVVRMEIPGNAQAGWWTSVSSGASLSTEFSDLSPNSPGKQALRVTVPAGQTAQIASYVDSYLPGKSFLQMNGVYTLTFRAKSTGGSNVMNVNLARPTATYFDQNVTLTDSWQDYSFNMTNYDKGAIGALALKFSLTGGSVLLDDAALTAAPSASNPTAFRNEVVAALQSYHPGTLRYMDSGYNWGSSIDNMIAVDFARERPGYSNEATETDQIPWGLEDFLVLCQAVGAEPWYTLQTGMSTQEMSNLMDFLGGSTATVYGAKRAALGQTAPWTTVFPKIHLEFGNEVWNTGNPGALIANSTSYGERAGVIFTAAKASASYSSKSFDFILDGFEVVPSWNQQVLAASSNYDTIDVATYFFSNFNDDSSIEKIFGPMFAEPESVVDSASGAMNQQAAVAAAAPHPAKLSVYESQLSITSGTASQTGVNSTQPSLGGGIAQADNMLLAMRDLGVVDQEMFALGGYQFSYSPTAGASGAASTTPIWGSVVDIGGLTNLQRPTFLAGQLANSAILATLLNTSQTGTNPTWNQALSTNDNVSLAGAHYIQSFAFTDGNTLNVILFNLSRTTALPVNFAGLNAPTGTATISTLAGPAITSNNEAGEQVLITSTTQSLQAGSTLTLAPYSMTVVSVAAPVIPIAINSISVTCPRTSLSPNDTMACSETVVGQGKYNSGVTWSVDHGTISSSGAYVAPATLPASGKATITVTSTQDTTKSASFAVALATNAITSVAVSCGAKSMGWGTATTCSATVSGTGSFTSGYTWSISSGTITTTGGVTAPMAGTSMTVTATSTQDTTKSSSANIALTPVLSISNPVTSITSTSITVGWTNSLAARNGVTYGIAGSSKTTSTPYDNTFTTSPSYTLTGLQPNTAYALTLISYDTTQSTSKQITVNTATSSGTITGVSASCGSSMLAQGGTASCTAEVSGTGSFSTAYTWTVSAGSVTSGGVVTAPATGTSLTVTATSTQDKTKSGSFTIALTPASTITEVSVTCIAASLSQGGTTTCVANVTGTGSFSSGYTWSVSSGSITSAGVVTAPTTGTSLTVTATSTQDKTKSGSFTIAVASAMTITNPVATVTSTSITVGWTVNIEARNGVTYSTGSISTGKSTPYDNTFTTSPSYTLTGLAPGTTYNLWLVSYNATQNTTKMITVTTAAASSTVSAVTVNCAVTTLALGGTTSCSAAVAGTGSYSSAVKWSVSAGTIASNGEVTAPNSGTSLTVTATSTQDSTKSGKVTLTLTTVAMVISDPKTVIGSTSIKVSWKVNILARNGVTYSTGSISKGKSTPYDNTFTTSPSYTISGLKPGTVYNLWLVSYNTTENTYKMITVTTDKE